jgi:CspA family cold shock protein
MAIGTVRRFDAARGYGFIAPSDGSAPVFVHLTAVERAGLRSLTAGQRVSFDIATEGGRRQAVHLATALAARGAERGPFERITLADRNRRSRQREGAMVRIGRGKTKYVTFRVEFEDGGVDYMAMDGFALRSGDEAARITARDKQRGGQLRRGEIKAVTRARLFLDAPPSGGSPEHGEVWEDAR